MAYLLDTYNLLHAGRAMGGAFADLTVRKLCQWIVASPRREKTTLIIDGRPKPDEPSENEFPELSLVYSGAGITADKVIAQTIARSKNRKNITVVTNDRAVAEGARLHYANAIGCEAFLGSLLAAHQNARSTQRQRVPDQKLGGTRSPGETEHWLKEFGLTPPAMEPPRPRARSEEEQIDELDIDDLLGGR